MCWMRGRPSSHRRARGPPLRVVSLSRSRESPPSRNRAILYSMDPMDDEFLPLPYFPWEVRPSTMRLEVEECATALYLSSGVISEAAGRLRVHPLRLVRAIRLSERLGRLHGELVGLLNDKVHAEVIAAFRDEDSRRREWASMKVINSRQFQDHPLAPNASGGLPSIAVGGPGRIVISWDDGPAPPLIEHGEHGEHGEHER